MVSCSLGYKSVDPGLGEKGVDPRRFVLYHDSQKDSPSYPYARLKPNSNLSWVEGFSLTRNEPVWVPANMVHLLNKPLTSDDRFEQCPISGYACGNTLEEAILGGLLEVVERDAFMIFWYHWLRAPGIDLTSVADVTTVATLARFLESPVRLFCSDITTDAGIPVALAGLTSWRPGWPATTVAMGAGLSLERAVTHAFAELSANLVLVASHLQHLGQHVPSSPAEVVRMEDHGLFYARPEMLPALDPLFRPTRWVSGPDVQVSHSSGDVKEDIEHCTARLEAIGLEVVVVNITVSGVSKHGLSVVKVLIPENASD